MQPAALRGSSSSAAAKDSARVLTGHPSSSPKEIAGSSGYSVASAQSYDSLPGEHLQPLKRGGSFKETRTSGYSETHAMHGTRRKGGSFVHTPPGKDEQYMNRPSAASSLESHLAPYGSLPSGSKRSGSFSSTASTTTETNSYPHRVSEFGVHIPMEANPSSREYQGLAPHVFTIDPGTSAGSAHSPRRRYLNHPPNVSHLQAHSSKGLFNRAFVFCFRIFIVSVMRCISI